VNRTDSTHVKLSWMGRGASFQRRIQGGGYETKPPLDQGNLWISWGVFRPIPEYVNTPLSLLHYDYSNYYFFMQGIPRNITVGE